MRPLLLPLWGLLFIGCANLPPPRAGQAASRSPLVGTWVIVEQTVAPLAIIPQCKSIRIGTTVTFTPTTFAVYPGASKTPCGTYGYNAGENRISFSRADMRWLCTYELTPNGLRITSTHFLVPDESTETGSTRARPPVNQAVVITLKRQ